MHASTALFCFLASCCKNLDNLEIIISEFFLNFYNSQKQTKMSEIANFESMLALDSSVKSSVMPRWQRKQSQQADRFIPSRSGIDFDNSQHLFLGENSPLGDETNTSDYKNMLSGSQDNSDRNGARVLAYKEKAPAPQEGYQNSMKVLYSVQNGKKRETVKPTRHIPSAPVRILDAPDLLDDYYLNLLSWGSNNVLAVALSQSVYLWDAAKGSIKELMTVDGDEDDYICSVAWIQQGGTHLAIGTASNAVQLWDVEYAKQVRSMDGHSARVGALAWNNHLLSSASRDTTIINHDVRIQDHKVATLRQHTQEVCGLAWSPDGAYLASGSNDNTLCIWDGAQSHSDSVQVKHQLTDHQASVKALAWSPHEHNLLASGGGTADRSIKFWNAPTGTLLNSIDTGSQVCALQRSPLENEILSSHGYAENQLSLWKYPTMTRTKDLRGHTSRVLHMATSPDGSMCVSGSADETLRFWNVFASDSKKKSGSGPSSANGPAALKSQSLKIR
jgi:cell division cycle protein 20 (cofactor of APC complex)